MADKPVFLPAGDLGVVVELGDAIKPEINLRVRNMMLALEKQRVPGVVDLVPTYRSLLVQYDPMKITYDHLVATLGEVAGSLDSIKVSSPRIVHIPTLYGGDYGPDLDFVAENAKVATDEVVKLHSGTDYLVYMMGFTPGFPYLGGLHKKLVTPRLQTPRVRIPAGSVGIAEAQTGVYPVSSPGGWRLIGRTPLKMFDPDRDPPTLIQAGDFIRFVPLGSEKEFLDLAKRVERGEYKPVTEPVT
ncbi:MAG: 5-oxoprolinase subunit PxpB [SAR202 cluster bacterium]|nr:5-oxoprolinase subunit PxpB [SAR202 cluster bacterium]